MTTGAAIAGKYHLLRPLGKGSMGEVWAAMHVGLGREVALKLIYEGSPELATRLKREAQACGRLEHPNIVRVYDYGETDSGDPFLVMELLTGETLADRLADRTRLHVAEALSIAIDVARALRAAHDAGVVHRDLKPANVFLCQSSHGEGVKVLDFGVSKIISVDDMSVTTTGALVGSPAYMSPEQARALREIDPRADLWSVGVLLFEMLTGTRPFPSPTVVGVVADILAGPIPTLASVMPGIDPRLDQAVRRCMTRELDQRMPSAAALIEALTPVLLSLQTPAAVPRPAPPQSSHSLAQSSPRGSVSVPVPAPAPLPVSIPVSPPHRAPAARPQLPYDIDPNVIDVPLNPNDPDEASTIALPARREPMATEPPDSEKETAVLGGPAGAAMRAVARAALANRAAQQPPSRAAPQVSLVGPPPPPPPPPPSHASHAAHVVHAVPAVPAVHVARPTTPSNDGEDMPTVVKPPPNQDATVPTRLLQHPFASPNGGNAGPRMPPPPPPSQPAQPVQMRPMNMPMGPAWDAGPQRPPIPAPIQTWPTQPPEVVDASRLTLPPGWGSAQSDARRVLWITALAGLVVGLVVFVGLSLLR